MTLRIKHGVDVSAILLAAAVALCAQNVSAQIHPPASDVRPPDVYFSTLANDPTAYRFERAWTGMAERVRINQERISLGLEPLTHERVVTGTKQVPVLAGKFANTSSEQYSPSQLENQLFNGPNATGTVTQFYTEISGGQITLTGTVYGKANADSLIPAQFNDTYYEGSCNGLGSGCSKVGDYLKELLDATDPGVDFGQYDNDGPDGLPNSGDDDGYVDFVAFVHPEVGGECGVNSNIWSHRWVYSAWWGGAYATGDPAFGGGSILVNDYTIQPLVSCGGSNIIEIGVFAHEFGHAFGLPDLYDTDFTSNGIGRWGLMSYGSWGGDGFHPETPVHMSAWCKEQLGWVTPTVVQTSQVGAILQKVETTGQVYKIVPGGSTQSPEYFLLEHRTRTSFDQHLPTDGVAIWHIDGTQNGNRNENRKLVDLEEADGLDQLDILTSLGDAGDLYPGASGNLSFDDVSYPNSKDYATNTSGIGITNISANANQASLDIGVGWHFVDATSGPLSSVDATQGVTWVDYDNDGDDDIYLAFWGSANKLLRNDGAGTFADVTSGPLGAAGPSQGIAWGDYDNDGDEDLYIANWGQANQLVRNDGNGSFTDVTTGVLGDSSQGTGVAWVDYDNDGDLDLYIANDNASNKLLRNDGGGSFSDATSGPLGSTGFDTAVAWADYDGDGDQDLYLGVVVGNNKMLRNDGAGVFVDATSGPLGDSGNTEGAAWGDYDRDGDLDLYLVNGNGGTPNKLLRNDGSGSFTDVTSGSLGDTGVGYGATWLDVENDGDLDLYLCNVGAPSRLFENDGSGNFVEVAFGAEAGGGGSQAVASADFDGDGLLDLFVGETWSQFLLQNVLPATNHWIHIDLVGTRSNTSAVGARVEVFTGATSQIREISAGTGHWSQDSRTIEVGLGSAATVDSVKVFWPGGTVQDTAMIAVDQKIVLTEPTVGLRFADHDVGNVVLTMTDQGILGFTDATQAQGSGFKVPADGENAIYVGGLWVSQCTTYVANRDYTDDPEQEWEVSSTPDGFVVVDGAGVSDQDIESSYRDTGGSDTRGLLVRQESWAWENSPDDDFVIVRYFVENEGAETQEDLFAGIFLDLDLGSAAENTGGADVVDDLIYMTGDSGVYAGLKRLSGDQGPDATSNITFIHNPTYVWPDAYVPDTDKRGFLQAIDAEHTLHDASTPDDYSVLVSVGPFHLEPGESNEVVFALVGGSSLTDLRANADRAQAKYLEVTLTPAGIEDQAVFGQGGVTLLSNYPNPFNLATTVRFEIDRTSEVQLSVFDIQGRRVRTLENGRRTAGLHSLLWDGRDERGRAVSNGIYYVRLRSGESSDSHRMVVFRR